MYDVIVIGCGVVGAATAYRLARYRLRTAVLEACNDVANGTTKANSAIIHAGYDPEPGTLMAALNVEGNRMTAEICQKLDVPFRRCGSLVVAFTPEDRAMLETLYQRGVANGVPQLQLLSGEEAHALEPALAPEVCGALLAPTAGIIDPWGFALAMIEVAVQNGVELHRSCPVTAIDALPEGGFRLTTPKGSFEARCVINAAGVEADRVHELLEPVSWKMTPNRGEYYLFDKSEGSLVNHVIFQCPGPEGKGVLVSPTVHGNLIAGPNAEPVTDRLDVGNTANGLAFVRARALKSVPGINFRQNIRNFSGIRANPDQGDFLIAPSPNYPGFIDLAGIKSPGLSSAPAIGKRAAELAAQAGISLEENPDFRDERHVVRFRHLPPEEKNALIAKDPRYGRVICRCETITEAEIVAALHGPVPACTVNGVKRRCNAGMGRCQGGFCGPRVQEIISRELGIPPTQICMEQEGSWLLACETKQAKEDAGNV